ncbi:MAG: 3-hydroxyacyl-CoA dehydrogenase family protein [Oligoflexia bacterium]|nr:3-hydroxyacyl-CoA dehydrogenase family protein [Oligoflexia bacterium]
MEIEFQAKLKKVAVLGAAGKMGSGISLLVVALLAAEKVMLIDTRSEALNDLLHYLKEQLHKKAEKGELSYAQIEHALARVETSTAVASAKGATTVFEAIIEHFPLKAELFLQLDALCGDKTIYFSNTSSIPICKLEKLATLQGRVMGFHFYNPPAIQKMVEVVKTEKTKEEVLALATFLGKEFHKILIPANDVAGFIGNGHLMREGLYAINEALLLEKQIPEDRPAFASSIHALNSITKEYLLRPMGIFQLIDYIGLDVFQAILKVMWEEDQTLHSPLIDQLLKDGVRGGQYPDGTQKDGFLQYTKSKPIGVYELYRKQYLPFEQLQATTEALLDPRPLDHTSCSWKLLLNESPQERERKLSLYFQNLFLLQTPGAKLAKAYLLASRKIALQLLVTGACDDIESVNAVLIHGFHHLYGPINNYY